MRLGIFGWLVILGGCSTAAAPPAAPTESAPAPSGTPLGPPAPPAPTPATCTESSNCAAGALCCPSVQQDPGHAVTPFGPGAKNVYVCTNDPLRDCEGHEVCGPHPCRSPWPAPHNGQITPSRTYVEECGTSRDCPKDTACVLYYFQPMFASSYCAYNVSGEAHPAHTAPLCATDADCKADLPHWKSVLGEQYASALASVKCVPLKSPRDTRRACAIPGFGPLP